MHNTENNQSPFVPENHLHPIFKAGAWKYSSFIITMSSQGLGKELGI